MDMRAAALDGLLLGGLFTLVVWLMMRLMPRGLLHMLPDRLESTAPAPTRRETLGFYCVYLPALAGITVLMTVRGYWTYRDTSADFWALFGHGYLVAMFLNLGDALLLDLVEIGLRPQHYGRVWGIAPDRLRARQFFRLLTFREHCLLWPLVYCPLVGLLFAALVGWACR